MSQRGIFCHRHLGEFIFFPLLLRQRWEKENYFRGHLIVYVRIDDSSHPRLLPQLREICSSRSKKKKNTFINLKGEKRNGTLFSFVGGALEERRKKRHNRWKCIERGPCGWGQRDGKDRLFRSADRVRLNGGAFSLYNHTLGRAAAGQEYSSRCVWLAADFFFCCRPKSVKNFFFIFFL